MTITVTVTKRIATISATERIVAGNTYPVTFVLDSEWTGSLYARIRFGSQYYDIPFASSDTSVNVQFPVGYPEVGIGVFSEALEICTNEVRVRLLRSILEQGVSVVDFDSDLYDQWAGEVSELLCDSDFDAESERPVKNSVLTAWKNAVPVDSALVHKTGSETITGSKTFNHVSVGGDLSHLTTATNLENGFRCHDKYYDMKDGSYAMFADRFYYMGGTGDNRYTGEAMRVYKPDRLAFYGYEYRAYGTGILAMLTGVMYPVDGQGNPQALTANALMASGNIAVDPRIVHTTGNETIAGSKTFTSRVEVSSSDVSALYLKSPTSHSQGGTKSEIFFIAKGPNGEDVTYADIGLYQVVSSGVSVFNIAARTLDGSTRLTAGLRCANDGVSYWIVPSYRPVDGQGVHLAPPSTATINSDMLAIDPRVVHTTGAETIAGVKTFSNPPVFASGVGKSFTLPSNTDVPIARIHLVPNRWNWNASMSFVVSGVNFLALCTVRRRQYNGVPIFEVHTLSVNPSWNVYRVVMDEIGNSTDGADITIGLRSEDTSTAVLKVSNINVFAPGTSDYTPTIPDSWTPGVNRQEWVIE